MIGLRTLRTLKNLGLQNALYSRTYSKLFEVQKVAQALPGDTSVTDSAILDTFTSFCEQASVDVNYFNKFRRARVLVDALDHVTFEQGKSYIHEILKKGHWEYEFSDALNRVDSVGSARFFHFKKFGYFSPTSLRYLKVYTDLKSLFGDLSGMDVAEIGVGFGGQAGMIHLLSSPRSYFLYDLPPVLNLAKRYLDGISCDGEYVFMDGRSPEFLEVDLVISNYAFSELRPSVQDAYLRNVILNSRRGYMTMNTLAQAYFGGLSQAELLRRIPNSQILPEKPLSAPGNLIIYWGP